MNGLPGANNSLNYKLHEKTFNSFKPNLGRLSVYLLWAANQPFPTFYKPPYFPGYGTK